MKPWYASKTLWFNTVAAIALLLQTRYGFAIDPEAQSGLLALINIILRLVTKAPLEWSTPSSGESAEGGFIRLPLLIATLLICASLLFAGCATTSPTAPPSTKDSPQVIAGKSLLAVQSTIMVASSSVNTLCKNGTLTVDTCTKAKAAYGQAKPAYDAAMDAYLLMTSMGGDPADFGRSLARVQALAADLLALSGGAQ